MMRKTTLRYWACQLFGWGGWGLMNFLIVYFFSKDVYLNPEQKKWIFISVLLIEFIWSIFATHLLRLVLKKINWMRLPSREVIMLFIAGVTITGLVVYYGSKATAVVTGRSLVEYEKNEYREKAKTMET